MRISDWSSDVCSSDLPPRRRQPLSRSVSPLWWRAPAWREQQRHHREIERADEHDRDADPAIGRLSRERKAAADQDEADRHEGGTHQAHRRDREKAFLGKCVISLGHASSLSPPRWRINSASARWPVASTPAITRSRSSADLFCDSLIVGRQAVIRISKPVIAPVILPNSAGFILARVHGGFAPTRASCCADKLSSSATSAPSSSFRATPSISIAT